MWKVIETKKTAKELLRLPKKIGRIYRELVDDLEREGPWPLGWDVKSLQGRDEMRIRLTCEYRAIIAIEKPKIIVIKVAHRREVYD